MAISLKGLINKTKLQVRPDARVITLHTLLSPLLKHCHQGRLERTKMLVLFLFDLLPQLVEEVLGGIEHWSLGGQEDHLYVCLKLHISEVLLAVEEICVKDKVFFILGRVLLLYCFGNCHHGLGRGRVTLKKLHSAKILE